MRAWAHWARLPALQFPLARPRPLWRWSRHSKGRGPCRQNVRPPGRVLTSSESLRLELGHLWQCSELGHLPTGRATGRLGLHSSRDLLSDLRERLDKGIHLGCPPGCRHWLGRVAAVLFVDSRPKCWDPCGCLNCCRIRGSQMP